MREFRPNALSIALMSALRRTPLPGPRQLACMAVVATSVAHAATQQEVSFNIAAGPLQSALMVFATSAKVSLKFEPELVKGKVTQGIHGNLSPQAALDALLKGTGLQAHAQADKVFGIEKVVAEPVSAPPKLGQVVSKDLATIYVTGAASKDYIASRSATASRTDTELGQTPQTVDVITRAMLDQQQSSSVYEALRSVPGITISGSAGFNGQVYVRGMTAPVTINGTSDGASGIANGGFASAGLGVPMAAIQGIEVLKGADAIVAGSPGNTPSFGLVNVVLKKPQAETVHELTVEGGTYGHKQVGLDLAGALNEDKSVLYRLVAQTQSDSSSPGGYNGPNGSYLAPSVTYNYRGGSLTAGAEFQHSVTTPPKWTYLDFDGSIAQPARPLGEASDHSKLNRSSGYLEWQQLLPDDWEMSLKLESSHSTSWSSYYSLTMVDDPQSFALNPMNSKATLHKDDLDFSVKRRFTFGAVEHKVVVGGNVQRLSIYSGSLSGSSISSLGSTLTPISDYEGALSKVGEITDTSLFLQDQIHWGNWYVLAALTKSSEWGVYDAAMMDLPKESATNPSIGVLNQITDSVALYANARKSFSPQASIQLYDLSVAPPQEGRSLEVGSKIYLNDDRLTMNIAFFSNQVTNSLRAEQDGMHLGPGYRSKGYEVSLTGELFKNTHGLISFSDTRLNSADPATLPDNTLPRYALRTFLTYDLPGAAAHGWSVGGGMTVRSSYDAQYGQSVFSAQTPKRMGGQASFDANVSYTSKTWSAVLGIKNLTGRTLYDDWATQAGVPVSSDRVFTLTTKFNF